MRAQLYTWALLNSTWILNSEPVPVFSTLYLCAPKLGVLIREPVPGLSLFSLFSLRWLHARDVRTGYFKYFLITVSLQKE
jgi:hypothetical protein